MLVDAETTTTASTTEATTSTAASDANSSTTPSSTSEPNNNNSGSGLPAGAKAGIAIGAVLGVIVIAVVAFLLIHRRRRTRVDETPYEDKAELEAGRGIFGWMRGNGSGAGHDKAGEPSELDATTSPHHACGVSAAMSETTGWSNRKTPISELHGSYNVAGSNLHQYIIELPAEMDGNTGPQQEVFEAPGDVAGHASQGYNDRSRGEAVQILNSYI